MMVVTIAAATAARTTPTTRIWGNVGIGGRVAAVAPDTDEFASLVHEVGNSS
jgi:hypothetical protein